MIDTKDSSDTPKRQQPLGAEQQREPRRLQLKASRLSGPRVEPE